MLLLALRDQDMDFPVIMLDVVPANISLLLVKYLR
jgi:hypothetical protein